MSHLTNAHHYKTVENLKIGFIEKEAPDEGGDYL